MNHEAYRYKLIYGAKSSLQSDYLNDLNLGTGVAEASGGQSRWALLGFFGRGTYDYAGTVHPASRNTTGGVSSPP